MQILKFSLFPSERLNSDVMEVKLRKFSAMAQLQRGGVPLHPVVLESAGDNWMRFAVSSFVFITIFRFDYSNLVMSV